MTLLRKSLLAGAAALLAGGTAQLARAQSQPDHVLTVMLPGGSIEQIRYIGAIPPHVVLMPPIAFGADPFADFARIEAAMDRQADAMLAQAMSQHAWTIADQPGAFAPAGGQGYSFVASFSGDGVCARSVTITQAADAQPHVVSHVSGNCGDASHAVQPTVGASPHLPGTVQVKAIGPASEPLYKRLVHKIAAWQQ